MKPEQEAEMMRQVALKMERWREATKKREGPVKTPAKGQVYESRSGLQFTITGCTQKEVTVQVDRVVHKNSKQVTESRTRVVPHALFQSFARAYELT